MDPLERMQTEYRATLRASAEALESAVKALKSENAADAMGTIRRLSHKLKGSGGLFGHMDISEIAGAILEAPAADVPGLVKDLLEMIDAVTGQGEHEISRVLIVDDNAKLQSVLEMVLAAPGREVVCLGRGDQAYEFIRAHPVDLVLLDLKLPDMDGRDLLSKLRDDADLMSIPVLVMSGQRGSSSRTECFAFGADMFFEKPFDNHELAAAVTNRLSQSTRVNRALAIDPFTGLPGRAAFTEALTRALAQAARNDVPLGLAMISVEGLDGTLAAAGPVTQDQAFLHAVSVVDSTIRSSDFLSPWGGHELAVLFQGPASASGVLGLRRAQLTLRETPFRETSGPEHRLTFSAGMVVLGSAMPVEEAMAEADKMLFKARKAGGDRVVSPDDDITESPPLKILLAEDDVDLAEVLIPKFRGEGFEVQHVVNGVEAIEQVDKDYDVLIFDIGMPLMTGLEALEKVRQNPDLDGIPVILMTASDTSDDIDQGFSLGANDYIVKPVSVVELMARIHRHVGMSRA